MPSEVTGQNSGTRRMFENIPARPGITLLILFAVLLPAIAAYWILYRQALFVPYVDDYAVVLAFADNYDQMPTLRAKVLDIAAAQVNEYKLVFAHSIVAAEIELAHHLNFAVLTTLGNLFLLPIGYFLWLTYQEDGIALHRRLLEFLPISFLFFSLTYWPNLNWATTALQNIPVVFFSLAAIYFLFPGKMLELTGSRLLLACLAAAMAAFASANGFLLGPVGLLILLLRRDYARSLAWCASFVLPLAAYLYHYSRVLSTGEYRFLHHQAAFFSCLPGLRRHPLPLAGRCAGPCDVGHPLAWRFAPASIVSIQLPFTSRCGFWRRHSWSAGCGERSVSRSDHATVSIPFCCWSFVIPFLPTIYPTAGPLSAGGDFTQLVLCSLSVSVSQPTCTLTKSSVRDAR